MIPDCPTLENMPSVLAMLARCPECGGAGYAVIGGYYEPPEQIGCLFCFNKDELFWKDDVRYLNVCETWRKIHAR